jgi:hypothetical protein
MAPPPAVAALLSCAAAFSSILAAAPAAGATTLPSGLSDGEWGGWISIGGRFTVDNSGVTLDVANGGNGTLDVVVAGGSPTGGFSIGYTSTGSVSGPVNGTTTGSATLAGAVGGSAVAPVLVTRSIEGTAGGEMNVNGQLIPIPEMPVSVSADQIPDIDLQFLVVGCDSAAGILGMEFEQASMATGQFSAFSFTGSWAISKTGATDPDDAAAIDIMARAEAMVTSVQGGDAIDRSALDAVLFDGERFLEASAASPDCVGSAGPWVSPIAGAMARLVEAILGRPDLDVSTLRIAVETAARAGLLSDRSSALATLANEVANAALDRAIAAGDVVDVILIEAIARAAGWTDVRDRAAAAADTLAAGWRSSPTPPDDALLTHAGVAAIEPTVPTGPAARPRFSWPALSGASAYTLVVRAGDGVLWAWSGAETTVALGTVTADAGTGPTVAGGAAFTVYAFGADDALIGASPWVVLP